MRSGGIDFGELRSGGLNREQLARTKARQTGLVLQETSPARQTATR